MSVDFCPQCGTPVVESIRTSFDTFVEGYVVCWKCKCRISLEVGNPGTQEPKEE